MKRIFGANSNIKRTSSDHRIGQPQQTAFKNNLNQTAYSYQDKVQNNH